MHIVALFKTWFKTCITSYETRSLFSKHVYYILHQAANTPVNIQADKFSVVIHASFELTLVSQMMSRLLVFINWWVLLRQCPDHSPGYSLYPWCFTQSSDYSPDTHCVHDVLLRQSPDHSLDTHCIHDAERYYIYRRGFPFLSGFSVPVWAHAVPVW